MSMSLRNTPPAKNPITAGTHGMLPISSAISIPGASNDQKLAAIITPAAKPSIPSRSFRLIDLKKNTIPAPAPVMNHVKQVARKACMIG